MKCSIHSQVRHPLVNSFINSQTTYLPASGQEQLLQESTHEALDLDQSSAAHFTTKLPRIQSGVLCDTVSLFCSNPMKSSCGFCLLGFQINGKQQEFGSVWNTVVYLYSLMWQRAFWNSYLKSFSWGLLMFLYCLIWSSTLYSYVWFLHEAHCFIWFNRPRLQMKK